MTSSCFVAGNETRTPQEGEVCRSLSEVGAVGNDAEGREYPELNTLCSENNHGSFVITRNVQSGVSGAYRELNVAYVALGVGLAQDAELYQHVGRCRTRLGIGR